MTTTKDEIAVLLTVLRAVVETGRVERIDIPHIERGISALTRFEAETMERAAVIAESYDAGPTARKEQAQHIAAALRAQKESI